MVRGRFGLATALWTRCLRLTPLMPAVPATRMPDLKAVGVRELPLVDCVAEGQTQERYQERGKPNLWEERDGKDQGYSAGSEYECNDDARHGLAVSIKSAKQSIACRALSDIPLTLVPGDVARDLGIAGRTNGGDSHCCL